MEFSELNFALRKHFQRMVNTGLYQVDVNPDKLVETYLASFPPGSDPVYRKRTEHDCTCCKNFIRHLGAAVTIVEGKLVTLWDFQVGGHYQPVVDALAALVRGRAEERYTPDANTGLMPREQPRGIADVFLSDRQTVGQEKSFEQVDGRPHTWNHFCVTLPPYTMARKADIGTALNAKRTAVQTFHRAICEITPEAVRTVLDLIRNGALHRGETYLHAVEGLSAAQEAAFTAPDSKLWCWANALKLPGSVTGVRNELIGGRLLVPLSQGVPLQQAVDAYHRESAGDKYKHPTAAVTPKMVGDTTKFLTDGGYMSAMERRYAVPRDITVQETKFADRSVRAKLGDGAPSLLAAIGAAVASKRKLRDVQEVTLPEFMTTILPGAKTVEAYVENGHAGNFMSVTTAVDPAAKGLFPWPNPFACIYTGGLADSVKERVKQAGGRVEGVYFRASLAWYDTDDLDLHLLEPRGGTEIYWADKRNYRTEGHLDVDMNASGVNLREDAVENIVYPDRRKMIEGTYQLMVENFNRRNHGSTKGFEIEIECDGAVYKMAYDKPLGSKSRVVVARFEYTHAKGLRMIESLPGAQLTGGPSREIWGVSTQAYRRVVLVMRSPNCWGQEDGQEHGYGRLKHTLFILDGCANPEETRAFTNEHLAGEFDRHRHVMEMLGGRLKVQPSENQLSGLGFTQGKGEHLVCRVTGTYERDVKIKF